MGWGVGPWVGHTRSFPRLPLTFSHRLRLPAWATWQVNKTSSRVVHLLQSISQHRHVIVTQSTLDVTLGVVISMDLDKYIMKVSTIILMRSYRTVSPPWKSPGILFTPPFYSLPSPEQTTNLFTLPIGLPFPECHIVGNQPHAILLTSFRYWCKPETKMKLADPSWPDIGTVAHSLYASVSLSI